MTKPRRTAVGGMALKRPCKNCPFRVDVPRFLSPARYRQIAAALVDGGQSFSCHETLGRDEEDHSVVVSESRSCAGAMIWLQHQGRPNQLMQVMERMGAFDPEGLHMDAPVYTTRAAFESGFQKPVSCEEERHGSVDDCQVAHAGHLAD
ncbi:DUF6283 family protein [Xanthomonas hortorum]|uniref:DUF6283 family protein n=1 Tax=Xanthomonas hortorum pv. hederae TaxID=453603 RepID=A0A9X4H697_9XANT|nr:DUF6283 family protein [Xanthomonas hortorum]MCE4369741.1 DUF6283 family protein [Xanthomonas hortorum pv. hederae]MDC8638756.1 DUF6283 family protein [Xanthomonas hortorum pv. hederae]PPU86274.1 hypothetical protein XhhCFBP4925_00675 [Xanthomonas hortorum pv. hederae]PUF01401.1 hypothetical protein C7T87_03545 [Xanthomonas hortorum pv. hederae]